ncbi:MAG: xylulokinase [Clostridiaceae bacterium]|nr:xylulokinase [Clostridiaceae bacterium]
MNCLMGIDIGTSSLKTTVINETGEILAVSSKAYTFESPELGYAEQNPDDWWAALVHTVRENLKTESFDASDIKGIGFSGQMHGMIPLDSSADVLFKSILHCDMRSSKQAEQVKAIVKDTHFQKKLFNPVFPGMQLISLLWLKEEYPEIYHNINYVLCPKDYIRYKLTGEIATERTDAAATLAYDVKQQTWCTDFLREIGIDEHIFPDPDHVPYEISGFLQKEVSEELGLVEGIPVVYGGGDQSMQSVGNGLYKAGDRMLTIGTSGQIIHLTDSPKFNPKLNTQTYTHVLPDVWFSMAAILSAGSTLTWFRNTFLPDASYTDLSNMAATVPIASEGILFFPAMMGERTPHLDPMTRGVFQGFSFKHKKEHFVRAILEGVCFEMKEGLGILDELYGKTETLLVSGGITNSPVWLEILSNILNVKVQVNSQAEQACIGAAMMAGVGCGIFSSVEEAVHAILTKKEGQIIEPDPNKAKIYQQVYEEKYSRLYEQNKIFFN